MSQLPNFIHPNYPNYACKLTRALYGLKQAIRQWFQCFFPLFNAATLLLTSLIIPYLSLLLQTL